VAKIKNAPTIKAFHEELANKHGFKVLSFSWVQGYRHFFTNKPIRTPEDLKGMRIRTPPAPIWQESVRALGATPVAMAFGDMYPALQQKAMDGVELVYNNIPAGRFYEVLKYVSETRHIMLVNYEVISSKWFNALPADYQKILVEECEKAGIGTSKLIMDKLEKEVKADLTTKRGMIATDKVDIAAFKKAGEKAYEVLKIAEVKKKVFDEIGKK
jgi:TRAP-type C4-dicarboxylate transport system substrate-binding protein